MAAVDDFISVLSALKGSAVSNAAALKAAKAYVYGYTSKWKDFVEANGYVVEDADPEDLFSVGTYDDSEPPVFTPVSAGVLNKGMARFALNQMASLVRSMVRSQWKRHGETAQVGDTLVEAEARADAAALSAADDVADDSQAIGG